MVSKTKIILEKGNTESLLVSSHGDVDKLITITTNFFRAPCGHFFHYDLKKALDHKFGWPFCTCPGLEYKMKDLYMKINRDFIQH